MVKKERKKILNELKDKSGDMLAQINKKIEKTYYEKLDRKNLEEESGFKIFLFHIQFFDD